MTVSKCLPTRRTQYSPAPEIVSGISNQLGPHSPEDNLMDNHLEIPHLNRRQQKERMIFLCCDPGTQESAFNSEHNFFHHLFVEAKSNSEVFYMAQLLIF